MPARTPQEIHELFNQYFAAKDAEALMSLYEPDAVFMPQPGLTVSGKTAIREALDAFLALDATFEMRTATVIQAGDIALLAADWTLKGSDPSGGPVELAGHTAEVVRRQPDGTWLMLIDNPYGA